MTQPEARQMVNLTIDGRRVMAREGTFLIAVAREAGIDIPSLCDHPDLEPVGACRVCMVEVTHPSWNGWSDLVTSCLYPVKEGLEVSTTSARVQAARKGVMSLLAARCPNSQVIQAMAKAHGAVTSAFRVDSQSDNCIVCGLCTRVCETYATSAISTIHRGAIKAVGTFANQAPEECVGCGACANVCPTDTIQQHRSATAYTVWNRTFETAAAVVDEMRCCGCGCCEEACPFSVAKVVLRAGGRRTAIVAADACRGCGACVPACPSGAIDQGGWTWKMLVDGAPSFPPSSRAAHECKGEQP